MSEREDLVLVTSFESLRAGDLVVVKACFACCKTHRYVLVRYHKWVEFNTGPARPAWEGLPHRACDNPLAIRASVSPFSVGERRVYRVVIPPAAETHETSRPAVRPKTTVGVR